MAAEVPVCDVLCEAMEYLSKLGTNLRTRSESLKEKRISKNKLRNAHALHKAAQKVLLICELSKKSLETVETGVRKVLSIVDASQAHTTNGGKNIDTKKQETNDNFYYFEYESCKLRISKKVPVKHFMSVKVVARSMPTSMQDKYPVYYDCKLKQQRKKSQMQCEAEPEVNSKRRESTCSSNTNRSNRISQDSHLHEVVMTDVSESNKSSKDENSSAIKKPKTTQRKSLDEGTENATPTKSVENEADNSQSEKSKNEQSSLTLVYSETKTIPASAQGKEDSSVSELIECFANVAKVNDSKTSCTSDKKEAKEANIVRKKFSKIKIVDDSSDSENSFKDKPQDTTQTENQSANEDDEKSLKTVKEPKSKKNKLNEKEVDSKSNEDSDCNSSTKRDCDQNSVGTDKSDNEQSGSNSKPLIRCVNITKLLKPDIISSKTDDTLNGKSKSKPQLARKMGISNIKNNNKQNALTKETLMRKTSTHNKNNDFDDEFWAMKRKEVKLFKPKKFTINVIKLPPFTNNFLLTHKLQKITQGSKTICEVSNINNKETEQLENNISQVKNALLIESGSEEDDSMTAEVRNVINSLLNDSDSELKDKTSQNSEADCEKTNQTSCEKLTDTAAIKDALLNESDSENNENTGVSKNTASESIATENDKGIEKNAEAIKSALLNDSDSDSNLNKDKTSPSPADKHSDNAAPCESTQDPETIKSSLLNDSSDDKSESTMIKRKKRKLSRIKKRHGFKTMEAKKKLLNYSSSSEDDAHSHKLDKDSKKRTHQHRRKSRISSSSSSGEHKQNPNSKEKGVIDRPTEEDNNANKCDEHSDSSVSKVRT